MKLFAFLVLLSLISGTALVLGVANSFDFTPEAPIYILYNESGNQTYYLNIPLYSYVKNATITIEGLQE